MRHHRSESASRWEFESSDRDWASRSLPLAVPCGSRGTFAWLTWAAPASPACCGPPCLSAVGEPDDPGSVAREPPPCGRDTTTSHSTHTRLTNQSLASDPTPGIMGLPQNLWVDLRHRRQHSGGGKDELLRSM